jgi:hypothetical protein
MSWLNIHLCHRVPEYPAPIIRSVASISTFRTLAPNTLESVYLHESPGHESAVHIDAIYKHILRKCDKGYHVVVEHPLVPSRARISGANYTVSGINQHTSGKMPQLKELGMAMHYRDWVRERSLALNISTRPVRKLFQVAVNGMVNVW